jgi:hypothetical protein
MATSPTLSASTAIVGLMIFMGHSAPAQTPEQQQAWDAQRAQMLADEKKRNEQLERERAARRANPMAWVNTLNPMTEGGWEFRAVANDGSWAAYTTNHQMKRSGKTVTVWLRHEYAEPQATADHRYLSVVEKAQYDCARQRERPLLVVYYSGNNMLGSEETEQADEKNAEWNPIVPGTRDETNFLWACSLDKTSARNSRN